MIRILFLWHQHQPFYRDLVSGEYRLPWVRMHALKDYYGMVKLLDEFPRVHQTFNLVPSLVAQIEDYLSGAANDPFYNVAAKPAADLTPEERRFAVQYLFQANPTHMIGRYPRYRELWEMFRASGESPEKAEKLFHTQDLADLQVLSQIAWFDEFFLEDADVAALVRKGRNFSADDQRVAIAKEREILAAVLPAHKSAAQRGLIELSTSPFYHPILPLLCDTNQGAVSTPRLPLPNNRFQHPEDARRQLELGLDLHQRVFGIRPKGVWPSEGSVSEEVLGIAHQLGVNWMATDEGVLGRSTGQFFHRDGSGRLDAAGAELLYTIHRYEKSGARMHLVFRDHTLSDLIGFVYSGMPAAEAAAHFIRSIKESAQPITSRGRVAVVPIILDGENAWEYYPASGREFLRRVYDGIQSDPELHALTISEAIASQSNFGRLESLVPGSWINANFDVWIGAPEDNRSWDYLGAARTFYDEVASNADPSRRDLAMQELMIAEGSDWNWWYGPEHHSANDRDFDELYRKHLANVYQALGAAPPEYLSRPIAAGAARPTYVAQTAYIRPHVEDIAPHYFDWIGAAMYTADRRAGSMHGKQFLLDSVYAGVDDKFLYARLDFMSGVPNGVWDLVLHCEAWSGTPSQIDKKLRVRTKVEHGMIASVSTDGSDQPLPREVAAYLRKNFVCRLPLAMLAAKEGSVLKVRFSLWRDNLPADALPEDGWIELRVVNEQEMMALAYS